MGTNDHLDKRNNAKKAQAKKGTPSGFTEWQGFINVELPPGAKKAWLAWHELGTPLTDALDRMLLDGYKITLKYEEKNDAYSAFCTGSTSDHHNAGWGLSERAGSSATALSRMVYIHAVVLNGDWDPYKSQRQPDDRWG